MTRGKIVLVTNDTVLTSTEFNGDMYYDWHGKQIVSALETVQSEQDYRDLVIDFNRENFEYEEEIIYNAIEDENGTVEELFDMTKDYFQKWFSDYLYIKNISSAPLLITTFNGYELSVEPTGVAILYFGELDKEDIPHCSNTTYALSKYIIEICENLGWHLWTSGDTVEFEKYSPAGEDFIFSVSLKNFQDEIYEYAMNFDPDEHAEMWVEHRGKGGCPSSIRDLIDDADEIDKMLADLSEAIIKYFKR